MKKNRTDAATDAAAARMQAVLNDGPSEMTFAGRQWVRGVPQDVTADEWEAMLVRGAPQLGFNLIEEN